MPSKTFLLMKPIIGATVIVNLTEDMQRKLGGNHINPNSPPKDAQPGAEKLVNVSEQKQAPAIITAVWSETTVNVKILGDSENNAWGTSLQYGTGDTKGAPNTWEWPDWDSYSK